MKVKGCCWRTNVARIADAVASDGDADSVGVGLLRPYFADDADVRDFLPLVLGDVRVASDAERVGAFDTLVVGPFVTFANSLAEASHFV